LSASFKLFNSASISKLIFLKFLPFLPELRAESQPLSYSFSCLGFIAGESLTIS
jgi:hypothetical protein